MTAAATPMNILIGNTVPVNGGDAALLFALYEALVERDHRVEIASYHFKTVSRHYPELPLVPEGVQGWVYRKLPPLRFLMERLTPRLVPAYRRASLILGCPGGYFNSYYGIRGHVMKMAAAHKQGKTTAIYSQSFGPFHDAADVACFKKHQDAFDLLMPRDSFSEQVLLETGFPKARSLRSNDAAFLLTPIPADAQQGEVAISVREWKHDARKRETYFDLIKGMARELHRQGYHITFLSTCQGVPGYVDDSSTALELQESLKAEGVPCEVDRAFHHVKALRKQLAGYEFVIGTRLHFCILSMLSGVPALNVSYEVKGLECYRYMGLEEYSVDYNASEEQGVDVLRKLIAAMPQLAETVRQEVQRQHEAAHASLDQALALLTATSK